MTNPTPEALRILKLVLATRDNEAAARIITRELAVQEARIREWVAKLYCASGCSCCRDDKGWEAASEALGELLRIPKYDDGSGRNWYAVRDECARAALENTNGTA